VAWGVVSVLLRRLHGAGLSTCTQGTGPYLLCWPSAGLWMDTCCKQGMAEHPHVRARPRHT
jgi:hypothetical protein